MITKHISMSQQAKIVVNNLLYQNIDFTMEKTDTFCQIFFDDFYILIHRFDGDCEVIIKYRNQTTDITQYELENNLALLYVKELLD